MKLGDNGLMSVYVFGTESSQIVKEKDYKINVDKRQTKEYND